MINNDLFITIVVMFLLSLLCLLALAGTSIWSGVDLRKYKTLRFIPVKILIVCVSLFVIYLGVPFWFLTAAFRHHDSANVEQFYDFAIKTAVFPSVKAFMYAEKGAFYLASFNGNNAIDAYEKSYQIKNSDIPLQQLCLLYTIKGDYDSAVATCIETSHNQMAAINSILNKNYTLALKVINVEFQDNQPACWDYAVRGHIHRALENKDLFKSDLDNALKLCPDNVRIKEIYNNSDYYENYYSDLRKKFHF